MGELMVAQAIAIPTGVAVLAYLVVGLVIGVESIGVPLPGETTLIAAALLASAERLQAMVSLATRDAHGGAIDRGGIEVRAQVLAQLATTVRRARLAGYNAPRA